MPKQVVSAMVAAGKATPAPPLGPALGALKVKVPDVIALINQKTKDLIGIDVPVKVIVFDDKSFEVEVGTPTVAALIKKELKIEKGSKESGHLRAGDLNEDQVHKIAKLKFTVDSPSALSQVRGTARSMGITIGQGAVTSEEVQAYETAKQAAEAAAAAATAAKAAAAAALPGAAAKTEGGEKKEGAPAAKAEEKKPGKDKK